jgi:hypothetical protein
VIALALVLVAGILAAFWLALLAGVGIKWVVVVGLCCSGAFLTVALLSRLESDPEQGSVTSRGRRS